MNRRVLLIDSDTGFHDALIEHLGRYGVVVGAEAEPEDALAMAIAEPPEALLIAVEEPEKQGFKTFQKARKQLPAKLPIVLITSSLTPEAFAKHRGLKVHADEYIDKREASIEDVVRKLDALISLGEPSHELPVADDIPMEIGEGDVVLDEEQVDEDPHGGFNDLATVNPGSGVLVDKMVAQETDAAFDALLGDAFGGSEPPIEEQPPVVVSELEHDAAPHPVEEEVSETMAADEAIPEPVPHKIPDPEPSAPVDNSDFDMDSVPAAIDDGGLGSSGHAHPIETSQAIGVEADVDQVEALVPQEAAHVEEPEQGDGATVIGTTPTADDVNNDFEDESSPALERDSLAAIPIVDDDLISLDDEMPVEVAPEDVGAEPMDDTRQPEPQPLAAQPAPEPATLPLPKLTRAPEPRAKSPSTAPEPRAKSPSTAPEPRTKSPSFAPAPRAKSASAAPPPRTKAPTANQPAVDLGLDAIAENAEREQSGVYDRKSLRKIDELERQVGQLKTELERAKAAAADASKGSSGESRETQFLKLREGNLAKEKELKDLKKANDQQAVELADAQEKVKQLQHAKQVLEATKSKLEERLFNVDESEKELQERAQAATARLAQAEAELEAKSKAAMAAETALAQMERDLATERANRAASASDAERTLRLEREQLIQRHTGELAAHKAESETAREHALARLREELESAHAAELGQAIEELRTANAAEHGDVVDTLEKKHAAKVRELETALAEAKQAHVAAVGGAEQFHAQALDQLRREHAESLEQAQRRHEANLGAREEELQEELDVLKRARQADAADHAKKLADAEARLERMAAEHAKNIADAEARLERAGADQATALAEAEAKLERASADKANALAEAEARLERVGAGHEVKLATAQREHDAKLAAAQQEHAATLAAAQQEHAATLAALQDEHEAKLTAAQRELNEAKAQHESAAQGLVGQHEGALAELRSKHEEELALRADEAKRTAEAHRAALATLQETHDAQLADHSESASRQITEAKAALAAAKKAADEAAAQAQAAHEDLRQAHASQIGELEAKHERAIAIVNGEALKAKAVADAEHQKELAAVKSQAEQTQRQLQADHAKAITDLTNERDELSKGLSGSRDALKRSEGELAAAVQTIADRNADLRAHAAAIAERDQRITELRAEIESLEQENASYQEQVLRAYQKIKSDEAMVTRARKAMAIALTVLDDQGNTPQS